MTSTRRLAGNNPIFEYYSDILFFDHVCFFFGRLLPGVTPAYQIYYLSTKTMALGRVPWYRDFQYTKVTQGILCPSMRRMPNLGSMSTELMSVPVNLARPVLNVLVSLPGLISIWGQQQSCPLVTHGHSLLRRCGSDLFSLDDFFDSLDRANTHFWASFGIVSTRVRQDLGDDTSANIIDGIAYYGHGTTIPIAGRSRYLLLSFRMPFQEAQVGIMNQIMPGGAKMFSGTSFLAVSPLRVARFSYRLVTGSIAEVIPLAIRADRNKADRDSAR